MLLSRIPTLDKGFVALIDSSVTLSKLKEVGLEFFGGEYPTSLEKFGSLTVAMKCPLFVQLNLSKFSLKMITASSSSSVEAYVPNAIEIKASDVPTSELISNDISRTTEALLLNPTAYQADGCDTFTSQVITPINVYTTLIIQGDYDEWCKFAYQDKVPNAIKAYSIAIQQIIKSEWK